MDRPPLDIEEAADVVIAMAAHRSSNQAHREFGRLIQERYFVELRRECKDDLRAKGYLDNLLAAMAAAVRGFSVGRDMFETRRHNLEKHHEHALERANRILDYAPLKEKGLVGKAFGVIGGSGLAVVLKSDIARQFSHAPLPALGLICIGGVLGLLALQVIIDLYYAWTVSNIEQIFPDELDREWQAKSLHAYRKIISQFLITAIKIREQYYPDLTTMNGSRVFACNRVPHIDTGGNDDANHVAADVDMDLDAFIDSVVDRHFAFGTEVNVPVVKPKKRWHAPRQKP